MKLKPFRNQILVKVNVEEQKTSGGIVLPSKTGHNKTSHEVGTIIDIGPLAFVDHNPGEMKPQIGDKILFSRYAGTFVDAESSIRLMDHEFVLAKVIED